MAQLSRRARRLAVVVQMHAGDRQHGVAVRHLAEQIHHRGMSASVRGAERQAKNGTDVILELTGFRALDGPVAGIMDARGHLVGEQSAILLEEFDRECADVIEVPHQRSHSFARLGRAALHPGMGEIDVRRMPSAWKFSVSG